MSAITSFGASLLTNPAQGQQSDKSVEELIQSPQKLQKSDSFEYVQNNSAPENTGGGTSPFVAVTAAVLGAVGLFTLGRYGALGKTVKRWCGGLPSMNSISKKIETKVQEYLGKNGQKVSKVSTETSEDGSKIITFEFENGTNRVFKRIDGPNNIRLEGARSDGKGEVIIFSKDDGIPKSRTLFTFDNNGKVTAYESYKGADILNEMFSDADGIYKSYSKTVTRKTGRSFKPGKYFLRKQNTVSTQGKLTINDTPGSVHTVTTRTASINGEKQAFTNTDSAKGTVKYVYDNNRLCAKKVTDLNGESKYYEAVYAPNNEGKQVLTGFTEIEG